ncbi:acylphosphatase [Pontibacter ramchanderi]|nr:acylphosphatase [Pontibacter ramchanderi]
MKRSVSAGAAIPLNLYLPTPFLRVNELYLYLMENKDKKRVAMRIHGRVQGVFFRASTQGKALELGLYGFVQNEPDGTVYLEAEGKPEALKELEKWAHQGPDRARVEKVEVEEKEGLAGFERFEQRR